MNNVAKETIGIQVYKEYFNFSAAHFLIYDDGRREHLHGHNYQVRFQAEGPFNQDKDIFIDFLDVKAFIRELCRNIDHVTLLPEFNRFLRIEHKKEIIEVWYKNEERLVFPKNDVKILPVSNISSELLAKYLCMKTIKHLQEKYSHLSVQKLEFSVEEALGQRAFYKLEFETPCSLGSIFIK